MLIVAAALGGSSLVLAQQPQAGGRGAYGQAQAPQQPEPGEPKVRLQRNEQPRLVTAAVPVNPTDAIAVVNGEPITRAQLADECIVRKGQEILETLIARKLIDQEIRRRKLDVTQAEVDHEIDDIAMRLGNGMGREAWLRTLDKERGISPAQYARDIIYPTIALRKLATGRVQVTDQDLKDAFEAHFGARLHCRIITVDKQQKAIELWEELKKNPGAFHNLAKLHSTDQSTRALGGYLTEPICRHAQPRSVSDPAFEQLVDGDPKDKNPEHAPKDGDITGPIQVNEMAWILIKRETIDPPKNVDPKDKTVRAQLFALLQDVKTKEAMTKVFEELMQAAEINNALAGTFKEARETEHPAYREGLDANVKLMAGQPATKPAAPAPAAAPARASVTPTGIPAEVAEQAKKLSQPIAPRPQ
jgi:foldase protein PrsA